MNYENLQPFGQLQSVTNTAFLLNFVLNAPHGHRVNSIRQFYSELLFHHVLDDWIRLAEAEVEQRLGSLFGNACREKFSTLVNALYGDDDEPERAPLYMLLSEDKLSPEEFLGKAYLPEGEREP